jgi:glucose/arabinose dehydrogenase
MKLHHARSFLALLAAGALAAAPIGACGGSSGSGGSGGSGGGATTTATGGATTTSSATGGHAGATTTSSSTSSTSTTSASIGGAGGMSTGGAGGTGTGGATTGSMGGMGGTGTTSASSSSSSSGAGGQPPTCDEPGGALPPLVLTKIASGLSVPVYATSEPEDATRLYIVEQTGLIKLMKGGVLQPTPFVDLTALIKPPQYNEDEKGLLGLAFHPQYAQNGRFFVFYSSVQGAALTLAEMVRSPGDPDVATPTPVKIYFSITQNVQTIHNGGMLAFGPDGRLYVAVGDGGGVGDPLNLAQNLSTKLGKILRIDVDTHPTPPPGNMPGGDPDIWDLGFRNPWRMSFDRCKGDLYIGDVGEDNWEEIDIEPAGQGNKNYGWSILEGPECYKANQPPGCMSALLTPPAKSIMHGVGCTIISGYVYRGSAIPALRGKYLYGDLCMKRIAVLRWANGMVQDEQDLTLDLDAWAQLHILASFGEDANGEVYVIDASGDVFRIDPE